MKITLTVKVALIVSLLLMMAISYIINKYSAQSEIQSESKDTITKHESVDEYNKRKRDENIQQKLKEEKRIKEGKTESNTDHGRKLTIDGKDPADDSIIDPINLWEDYETRTYAGKVNHGEIVTLIKREGDGVFIETKSGSKGWLTYFFIKEFKMEK